MNKPDEDDEMWNEDGDEPSNPTEVLAMCMQNFSKQDYILEPAIFLQLKR